MKLEAIMGFVLILVIFCIGVIAFFNVPVGIFSEKTIREFNEPSIVASPLEIMLPVIITAIVFSMIIIYYYIKEKKENEDENRTN